jgi:hypothetical protein
VQPAFFNLYCVIIVFACSDECTDSSFEEEEEPCPPTPQNNYDKILL